MGYLLLLTSAGLVGVNSVFCGIYNRKNEGRSGATSLFNLIFALSALVCWGIRYCMEFSFDPRVLPYSLGFGLAYCSGCTGLFHALKNGPVSVTSMLVQLSTVATVIWGAVFWNAPLNTLSIIGLVLVVIAMALCIQGKPEKAAKRVGLSFKWLFYVLLAFLGNGFCMIFQRSQVIAFTVDGVTQHSSMMMFFGMVFAALFVGLVWLKSDRTDCRQAFRNGSYLAVFTGLSNFATNLINQYLAIVAMPPAIQYPVFTLVSLAVTAILARICFKERLYWWQWLGMGIGAAASILLSLA